MRSKLDEYISQQHIKRRKSNNRKQVLAVLSLFVVTSVFWCLKMTGITMAGEAFCGMDEHKHSTECGQYVLVCTVQEQERHIHNESCILKQLVCSEEESDGHTHAENCYNKTLICTQEGQSIHTHNDECKRITYICGLQEASSHFHNADCNGMVVICGQEEIEAHTHSADCFIQDLICTETSEEHIHDDNCYKQSAICGRIENPGHIHDANCMEEQLVCTLEENSGHTHTSDCQGEQFICGYEQTDGHVHTENCYSEELICSMEETVGHMHTTDCYVSGIGFGCLLTEADGHIHTAECITEDTQFDCGKELTELHTHTEECYQFTGECTVEEHIHTERCYSNINADLETDADWEATLAGVVPGARVSDNLIAVARSQLGYTESILNFEVNEEGQRNGYTRYGQWYGNPYGQWNTMFVSFCLHYSQIQGIPLSAGAETMRLEWESIGLYESAQGMSPSPGNLIFLDKNANGTADATAIVTEYNDGRITVIEGDVENTVAQTVYFAEDVAIMGYGVIPDISGIMTLEERAATPIAKKVDYSTSIYENGTTFVIYTQRNGNYYAIDGDGQTVAIYIDAEGNITTDVSNPDTILWTFDYKGTYDNQNSYYVKNLAKNNYLHPNYNLLTTSRNATAFYPNSTGVKIRGENRRYYANLNSDTAFSTSNNSNNASIFYLGKAPSSYYVWLDGTDGDLDCYTGSDNTRYKVNEGATFTLPITWRSPTKYNYKIRGWYDVTNSKYYSPGAEVVVSSNMVFYADWVAATYDIGIYDKFTSNTVSSEKYITTRVFDYNPLFNVMSANAEVTVTADGHSEDWAKPANNVNITYNNQPSRNFMFVDQDSNGQLHNPDNRGSNSTYNANGVTQGIYSEALAELLFGTDNEIDPQTGQGVMGKTYLGTGDYLFQYGSDPNNEYYGYYYYDSKLNAASYNQSAQRFYVYDYLEATSDTLRNNASLSADFLPFNSIYANTNGQNVPTYSFEGAYGEYEGVEHHRFDSAYSGNNNSVDNVITNYSFGMAMDVKFHLPDYPGAIDEEGAYKNRDVYGKEICFRFSGDDDVWVLVDGQLVMDIGGIHQIESGEINFATGIVTVDGKQQRTIYDIEPGEHVLTMYYLDRGGSMSNCAMYYNLAPRYSLNIQKEDVLSQQLLDGAKFAVYTDKECTTIVDLWTSEESYINNDDPAKEFTVVNGSVDIWGFSAGKTYYIKEIGPPSAEGYELAKGIIRFSIDKKGNATYNVEIIEETDKDGNKIPVSNGYTVHGVRIDEDEQKAYIVVTNAQNWVNETTTVQTVKIWEDNKDHSGDYITVYLTVKDPDGTVRRIREITLSNENGWTYTWTNLPKFKEDLVTEVQYGVAESYEEGYYSTSTKVDKIAVDNFTWAEAYQIENGEKYLLKTSSGCLATTSETATSMHWVNEESAKSSPLALWTATVSGGKVKFTNGVGQVLTFNYSGGTYFYATTESEGVQALNISDSDSLKLSATYTNGWRTYTYYLRSSINSNNGSLQASTSSSNGVVFSPMTMIVNRTDIDIQDWGFKIVNTPLEEETSLTVTKAWSIPSGDATKYQENQVTVKLLANGVDTGRTVTLTLKNNWTDTFRGLPYKDSNGNIISYTVQESWETDSWVVNYGPIVANTEGQTPTYSTTVTNKYMPMGPELPSTGSFARMGYVLCGSGIMLASLIYGIGLRRRKERREQ